MRALKYLVCLTLVAALAVPAMAGETRLSGKKVGVYDYITLNTPLALAYGGTGNAGTDNQILTGNTGAAPSWSSNLTLPGWLNLGGNVLYGSAADSGSLTLRATSSSTTTTSRIFAQTGSANTYATWFNANQIGSAYGYNSDDGALYINWRGYLDGTTRFRDLFIGNGKEGWSSRWDGSAGTLTHTVDVLLGDNKYLKLGAGPDLLLSHDGTNSHVGNSTGILYLKSDELRLTSNSSGAEAYLKGVLNGAVTIYYDNSVAMATAGAGQIRVGVDDIVYGQVIASGQATGSDIGGIFQADLSADNDSTIAYYRFSSYQDDLHIGPSTNGGMFKLTAEGNFLFNASQGATAAGMLFFGNGTLPTVFPNAGIGAESGEVKVWDTAGNVTTISPHGELDRFATFYAENPTAVPWTFTSRNPYTGRYQIINMGALVAAVEALTGKSYTVTESVGKQEWSTDQGTIKADLDAKATAERTAKVNELTAQRQAAEVATLVAASKASRDAAVIARAADLQATYGDAVPVLDEDGNTIATRTPTEQAELETDPAMTKDEALALVDVAALRAQADAETAAITPYTVKDPPAWLAARIAAVEAIK